MVVPTRGASIHLDFFILWDENVFSILPLLEWEIVTTCIMTHIRSVNNNLLKARVTCFVFLYSIVSIVLILKLSRTFDVNEALLLKLCATFQMALKRGWLVSLITAPLLHTKRSRGISCVSHCHVTTSSNVLISCHVGIGLILIPIKMK